MKLFKIKCFLLALYYVRYKHCLRPFSKYKSTKSRDCLTIAPVTVEESCQPLLKNYTSDCWRILPVIVEELCQWLLMNGGNGCWTVVPAVFFSLFNFTLAKSLPVFRVNTSVIITDYFNSGSQLSKLQVYWLIIIFIFSLYTFYQPL